ncbi:MAG: molybdopterin molybdotransferase MoeA [Chitinophagaceae bacterium]|nr:molybdopterin molybdotransferase MoeA [Chitinophagaceae bacterium]
MITVTQAKELIALHTQTAEPVRMPLPEAAGLVLAEDVLSPLDIPAYPQASMDGYALNFDGYKAHGQLEMAGVVAAGSDAEPVLQPSQAMRIFTGAAVPEGADTIVIQEKSGVHEGKLVIQDDQLQKGLNVRPRGSEISAGELALPKGSRLSPAAIGFLTGIGLTHVTVYPPPSVCIIVTGNELQDPGQPLKHGQVYESNSHTLRAVLAPLHITRITVDRSADSLETLTAVLEKAVSEHDMVLLNGGISVGDYDYVLKATELCGIDKIFHKIKQKPGKPIYFGTKDRKLVFGLPGNPASVLTCFYEYVTVALEKLFHARPGIQRITAPLAQPFKKPAGLTHFLKGYYDGSSVLPLDAQESYRLSSFARANCLIVIEEDITYCEKGEMVEVHLLPV